MTADSPTSPAARRSTAYGNGGFRFAGMSHRGSILCLPSGIYAWDAPMPDELSPMLRWRRCWRRPARCRCCCSAPARQVFPSRELKAAFEAAGIALEPMATGAAARTYNVLLAEGRRVGAALLAVD